MKKLVPLFALTLSACATPGQMQRGLDGMIGQPLSTAVDKLGLPTSENTIAGMHLVTWQAAGTPDAPCRITLQVDDKNIIRKHNFEGTIGGCERYIKAVRTQ